jgi:Muramidase (flagellum-specific)
MVLQAKDVEAQLRAIGLSGYATSPTYGSALLSIYRANKDTIEKQVRIAKIKMFGITAAVAVGSFLVFKNPRVIQKTFAAD